MKIAPVLRPPVLLLWLCLAARAFALEEPAETPAPVRLDPFEVRATPEGYMATESVAATRIAVPLENLPINVSIANAEFMQQVQAHDILDVLRYKGVNAIRDVRFNSMYLRGFNNTLQKRNGVTRRYNWQTVNLEQVEIVKGPASILYGAVLPGGAVMSVSKKPTGQPHLDLLYTAGSYDFNRAAMDFGTPLGADSRSAYRLIAEWEDSGDYYFHTFVKRTLINPVVRLQMTDRLRLDLEYERIRHKESQANYYPYYNADSIFGQPPYPATPQRQPLFPVTGFSRGFLPLDPRDHNTAPGSHFRLDSDWFETTAHLELSPAWTLRWLVNYNTLESRSRLITIGSLPYAGGEYADLNPGAALTEFKNFTTFAEITGRFALGTVEIVPMFGAEWNHETDQTYNWDNRPPLGPPVRIDTFATSDIYYKMPAPVFSRRPKTTRENHAVYGLAQAEFMQGRFRVLGGLRYGKGETNPLQQGVGPGNSYRALSSQLGFVYRFNADWVTFLNLSESFVPNTIVNPDGGTLPLETGRGAELGVRWIRGDGRLAATATVFHTVRDRMARLDTGRTFDIINNPQQLQYFTTSGEECVQGAELEIYARPLPAWDVTLNYNWLPYAKVISFPNRPDIEGNRLRNAPEHSVGFWSKFWLNAGERRGFYLFGGLTYQSITDWDADKTFTEIQFPAWTNYDAGAGWEGTFMGKAVRVELLVKNLGDRELGTSYIPEDRRKWFLTTSVKF